MSIELDSYINRIEPTQEELKALEKKYPNIPIKYIKVYKFGEAYYIECTGFVHSMAGDINLLIESNSILEDATAARLPILLRDDALFSISDKESPYITSQFHLLNRIKGLIPKEVETKNIIYGMFQPITVKFSIENSEAYNRDFYNKWMDYHIIGDKDYLNVLLDYIKNISSSKEILSSGYHKYCLKGNYMDNLTTNFYIGLDDLEERVKNIFGTIYYVKRQFLDKISPTNTLREVFTTHNTMIDSLRNIAYRNFDACPLESTILDTLKMVILEEQKILSANNEKNTKSKTSKQVISPLASRYDGTQFTPPPNWATIWKTKI